MRTRCPDCGTVFRVTSEQLRLRAGKVRCGHCQAIFNAFDALVSEVNEPLVPGASVDVSGLPEASLRPVADVTPEADVVAAESPEVLPGTSPTEALAEPVQDEPPVECPVATSAATLEPLPAPSPENETVLPVQEALTEPRIESPEASTQAARQAGLVAARELNDTSSFNRWSAGTLTSDGAGGFDSDANRRSVWPFVLVAIVLIIGLLGQLLYYFRTDVVLRFPGSAGLYAWAEIDVPLPRNAALVSIENSDLQADSGRGMFILLATLKNQAPYAQAWPALELTLTDTNDAVVSRRVIFAADYLPPGTTADAFAANGELAVKLWVEAKDSGASGYRLYLFYP